MIGSSGRQRVQTSCFDEFAVSLPPGFLLESFDNAAEPCFKEIQNLQMQNQALERARDLLLPRLMNGELAV
jgi:type I restriction enzyme S subunit